MNQGVDRNRKLFWKEVSRVNGRKVESCSRIKDGSGRLVLKKDKAQRIWKDFLMIFII